MASFRFEMHENVVTKHHLSKVDWSQAARWVFVNHFDNANWTVASVRNIDADTVEIIKRRDVNKSIWYKMGFDQMGLYERVVIDRKEQSVAVDRLDFNWLRDEPFLARRDLFVKSSKNDNSMDFIRHHLWLNKLLKFEAQLLTHYSSWSYRRAFRKTLAND